MNNVQVWGMEKTSGVFGYGFNNATVAFSPPVMGIVQPDPLVKKETPAKKEEKEGDGSSEGEGQASGGAGGAQLDTQNAEEEEEDKKKLDVKTNQDEICLKNNTYDSRYASCVEMLSLNADENKKELQECSFN